MRRQRRYDESLRIYDRALKLDPQNAKCFQSRGELFTEIKRTEDAFRDFDRALAINPKYRDPLWAKGFTYLMIGEFDKGWDLYDYRFEQSNKQTGELKTTKPRWTPAHVTDPVLVWSEQGIGDELFFAQWLGRAHEIGREVVVAADSRLIAAYARSFQNVRFLDKAALIPESLYGSHLPLGSLPKALRDLGIDWRTNKKIPYLRDDARHTTSLKNKLARNGKRICGITWRSARPELGPEKSLTLAELLPLLQLPGYTFVNLQYGDTAQELAKFRADTGIDIVTHPEIDNFKNLNHHISLVAACDELVLACNATAHVAGAMGRRAHLLTPRGKSLIWYWANRNENRSLWYPSIELFDQSEQFSWQSSIDRIAAKLST